MKIDRDTMRRAQLLKDQQRNIKKTEASLVAMRRNEKNLIDALPKGAMTDLAQIGLPQATVNRLTKAGFRYVYEILPFLDWRLSSWRRPEGMGEGTLKQVLAAVTKHE